MNDDWVVKVKAVLKLVAEPGFKYFKALFFDEGADLADTVSFSNGASLFHPTQFLKKEG
jgi:hypothetical protein